MEWSRLDLGLVLCQLWFDISRFWKNAFLLIETVFLPPSYLFSVDRAQQGHLA